MEPFTETERAASVKRPFDEDTRPAHTNKIAKMNVPLKSDFDRNSLKHALARWVSVSIELDNWLTVPSLWFILRS
jgi:hypothetical protein